MPLRSVPGTDLQYHLICFDKDGHERREDDGRLRSEAVRALVADAGAGITDVFFLSHGWKGDVPAAIDQYDRWIAEMARSTRDREEARRRRPGFHALIVGLHWPSQPWGDESLTRGSGGGLLSAGGATPGAGRAATVDELVDAYADRIADTPAARAALRTILESAQRDGAPAELPPMVRQAYATLREEARLVGDGEIGESPDARPEPWDPATVYREARADQATSGLLGGGGDPFDVVLSPLRQLSFWKMKDRARRFGEGGAAELLRGLQVVAPPTTRFHLMGHSFGCIVVSATVAGGAKGAALVRPVDSLLLVQGALSLWAYCDNIPHVKGTPGYFHRILQGGMVRGPIVTTRSRHDTAVAKFYPMGARVAGQAVLGAELPKYGGIGAFGAQGLGTVAADLEMQAATFAYGFQPGHVYNIDASRVIAKGDGASGAHSDIVHPEVAHVAWEAALTGT